MSEAAAEPPYVILARQALPVRLVGQALQEPQPPVPASHHTLCQPARPPPAAHVPFRTTRSWPSVCASTKLEAWPALPLPRPPCLSHTN